MTPLLLLLLGLAVELEVGANGRNPSEYSQLLSAGTKLATKGEFKKAKRRFHDAIIQSPKMAGEAWLGLGICHENLQDLEMASVYFEKALRFKDKTLVRMAKSRLENIRAVLKTAIRPDVPVIKDPSLQKLWPTPVLVEHGFDPKEVGKINAALKRIILDMEANGEKNVPISSRGGWQSTKQFFTAKSDEAVKKVFNAAKKQARKFLKITAADERYHPHGLPDADAIDINLYTSWANVHRSGNMNLPHVHQGGISGVYYVDVDDSTTPIEFVDPRAVAEYGQMYRWYGFGGRVSIFPKAGDFIIFPAWLQHFVSPHTGSGTRISISFNVHLPNLGI
jgi:uncharacterized protein (TIGR02466 family)